MEDLKDWKQFQKEFLNAHWCKKCDGKIVCIKSDMLGNTYCGYCGEKVKYPRMNEKAFKKYFESRKCQKK